MTRRAKPAVPPGWRVEESHWRAARWVMGVCAFVLGALLSGIVGHIQQLDDPVPAVTVPRVQQAMPTVTSTVTATVQAPAQAVASPPAAAPGSFGDGVYLVGEDMEPGVYKTTGGSGACYWARIKNANGGPADGVGAIIDNHLGEGPSQFTAKKGEFVEIRRCVYKRK